MKTNQVGAQPRNSTTSPGAERPSTQEKPTDRKVQEADRVKSLQSGKLQAALFLALFQGTSMLPPEWRNVIPDPEGSLVDLIAFAMRQKN